MCRSLTKNVTEINRSVIIIFFYFGAIICCIKVNFVRTETNFLPLEPNETYNMGRNGKRFLVLGLFAF